MDPDEAPCHGCNGDGTRALNTTFSLHGPNYTPTGRPCPRAGGCGTKPVDSTAADSADAPPPASTDE